jgi:hypothetical protein
MWMSVVHYTYFIWFSSKINQHGQQRTVETRRIYVIETNYRVNRNEHRTDYSSVLTLLTAVFRDSTGLLYRACVDMIDLEPRCCELVKMNKAAYGICGCEPGILQPDSWLHPDHH